MRTLSTTGMKNSPAWTSRLAGASLPGGRRAHGHGPEENVGSVEAAQRSGAPFGKEAPRIERHRTGGD